LVCRHNHGQTLESQMPPKGERTERWMSERHGQKTGEQDEDEGKDKDEDGGKDEDKGGNGDGQTSGGRVLDRGLGIAEHRRCGRRTGGTG